MAALETQSDALAQVYARSLFEMAEARGGREQVEEIGDELEQLVEITRNDDRFVEFLRSAILPAEARGKSLRAMFEGRVSPLTLHFLLVLNEKGRLPHLAAIATGYDELLQEKFGRVEVDVFTAGPIESGALESIKDRVRQSLGKEPVLHHYTDEAMIGGLKLRIADQLIDGSIATRLRKMREQLARNGTARVRSRAAQIIEESA